MPQMSQTGKSQYSVWDNPSYIACRVMGARKLSEHVKLQSHFDDMVPRPIIGKRWTKLDPKVNYISRQERSVEGGTKRSIFLKLTNFLQGLCVCACMCVCMEGKTEKTQLNNNEWDWLKFPIAAVRKKDFPKETTSNRKWKTTQGKNTYNPLYAKRSRRRIRTIWRSALLIQTNSNCCAFGGIYLQLCTRVCVCEEHIPTLLGGIGLLLLIRFAKRIPVLIESISVLVQINTKVARWMPHSFQIWNFIAWNYLILVEIY